MNRWSHAVAVGLVLATAACSDRPAAITGAGATFPFPLYARWAEAYYGETQTRVNYQPIGSSAGIRQIRTGTVDFGATDAPLTGEELRKDGLVQFPVVIGGIVPIYNIEGVPAGQLKLTGEILADIFNARITRWNDARIIQVNQGVTLPDAAIAPVYRSDGSGTTDVFTTYLSQASEAWKGGPGAGASVQWPIGQGGKGNEGVAALVKQVSNSIGYVEYAYAKQTQIPVAQLWNAAGRFIAPDAKTFQAAAAGADWKPASGFGISLTNQPGEEAWPITSPTFILVHKAPEKPGQVVEVLRFFDWAFSKGDPTAVELDYVPLPNPVKDLVRATWQNEVKDKSGQPLLKKPS
ncbi:phosphate ABC transporter substrate-binding protein PstS [Microvirga aerophila]|uniref:Phosphate-binding protein PstS n=1 Tax=Microvirga aerophila TaxID=670291 RepID=A0A512BP60_9HYPH|nr:phosphate ABC transporter substrate-binding protein PstS [Microvirga aerophila]GEO13740.1 phosphate-binding protein PstS [Microvirga aerophila]